jgi:hypothetical protein
MAMALPYQEFSIRSIFLLGFGFDSGRDGFQIFIDFECLFSCQRFITEPAAGGEKIVGAAEKYSISYILLKSN